MGMAALALAAGCAGVSQHPQLVAGDPRIVTRSPSRIGMPDGDGSAQP